MTELSASDIDKLKQQLLDSHADLEEQILLGSSAGEAVALDQSKVGRVSRIDAMQQQQMALSTLNKSRQRLVKIKVALAAIESGDYGYCKRCDENIGFPRLQAQPEAPLCFACQDLSDSQQ